MKLGRRLGGGRLLLLFACAFVGLASPRAALADVGSVCRAAQVDALLDQYRGDQQRRTIIDKSVFYNLAKAQFSIFKNPGNHYVGTDSLIDYWNSHRELTDLRWLAYIMGTSYHETARRMFPVRETLASTDAAVVAILARSSHTANKTYWKKDSQTGQHYYGRGHVQLTWRANYELADRRLGRDPSDRSKSFLWTADLALDPKDSVDILFDGMIYGWYTQKHCLPFYFDPEGVRREDWKNARRIVNVLDRWQTIADHGRKFLAILRQSEVESELASIGGETGDGGTDDGGTDAGGTGGEGSVSGPGDVTQEGPTPEELLASAQRTINELGAAKTALEAQIATLNAQAAERASELDQVRRERDELSSRLTALEAQVAGLGDTVSALEAGNADLQRRLDESESDRQLMAERQQAMIVEQTRMAGEVQAAEENLAAAKRELDETTAALSVSEARNSTLENRVDALAHEEQRLRQRLSEAETRLRQLQEEANKSWWSRVWGG